MIFSEHVLGCLPTRFLTKTAVKAEWGLEGGAAFFLGGEESWKKVWGFWGERFW